MDFKKPKLPALSSKTPSDIRRAINAIAEYLGGMADKSLWLDKNIRNLDETVKNIGDYPPQPAPTGLAVSGGFNTIFLEWDQSKTSGFAYTEIWRATEDNLSLAAQVGSTSSPLFGDTPPDASLSVTYYYWIRYVNEAGQPGPYNSEHGTPGSTADEPGYVLEVLKDEITEGQLYKSLNERLDHIETTYEVKVDVNGRVTGFGMVADVNSTEFGINADRFWVADPSDSANVKIPFVIDNGQVVMDTALIRELTATNFVGEKIVADEVKAAGVKTESLDAGIITADKYKELRQTYVFTGADSMDSGHPFEVPFRIVSETTVIRKVRVSFKVTPWRSYEKSVAVEPSTTTGTGGGESLTSTGGGLPSYADTGSAGGERIDISMTTDSAGSNYAQTSNEDGGSYHSHNFSWSHDHNVSGYFNTSNHTHDLPDLSHEHTVDVPDHSHSIPSHNHGLEHGIYENDTGASVNVYVGGILVASGYTSTGTDIDITDYVSGVGWKSVKFTASNLCRVSAIVECKVDITA
jgi:hypothetical protein